MMSKVAIMTDTIACIPQEMVKEYGIKVIPFHAILDGKSYLDTEVNMGKLYARLKEKEKLPTTSFPSSEEFLQAYLELSPRAEAILYISMTSAFSASYKAAIQAKEIVQERLPETKIEVIDSYTLESGELLIVTKAARAAREGKNLDEVVALVNEMITKINLLQATDTLFYRDKGGRIFEAKSWAEAESTTSFKAILEVDAFTGGVTKPIARAKTKKQLIEKMVNIAKERMGNKKFHAAIAHTNVLEQAEQLKEMLLSQCHCDEPHIGEASVMSAIHNGEGFISFGFYGSD